mmetsp:Transcript_30923/g.73736  ORF Transcript_30923/g.73736 Transcript_30923/m.73736 type:complete len:206 (-) Transcript_30923:21-638(-)
MGSEPAFTHSLKVTTACVNASETFMPSFASNPLRAEAGKAPPSLNHSLTLVASTWAIGRPFIPKRVWRKFMEKHAPLVSVPVLRFHHSSLALSTLAANFSDRSMAVFITSTSSATSPWTRYVLWPTTMSSPLNCFHTSSRCSGAISANAAPVCIADARVVTVSLGLIFSSYTSFTGRGTVLKLTGSSLLKITGSSLQFTRDHSTY